MADKARDISDQTKTTVDKELRLKYVKERQYEERQKKLEEIKAQALAAQRFKEQKGLERRRRLEDLKEKEDIRRQQVEERKKAIVEAEQQRLVSILRRNQEREARIEAKRRNERSSNVFAFGSSTPRLLDATDMNSSFWGHRRATSIQNISDTSSLSRRTSERDLDVGNKKRATSAGGLERTEEASSRPSSSLSQQSTTSMSSSVSVRHRPSTTPRRPRPASIAITGITHDLGKNADLRKPPLPTSRKSVTKEKVIKNKISPVEPPKSLESPVSSSSTLVPSTKTSACTIIENVIKAVPKEPPEAPPTIEKSETPLNNIKEITKELIDSESKPEPDTATVISENFDRDEMTSSFSKVRINTEEEAKAALAERRRIAREEAERQAEQERLRIEREHEEEMDRQRREEEQVQRLVEQQRIAEKERLEEAIRETQKREEEEKLRREEEQRQKVLKEEADKKAKEEAEKKMAEQQERLKNEEKEREARRKRVEAIMRRTRGVNSNSSQNSEEKNENKSDKLNGTKVVEHENGTKNGKDVDLVDNIIPDDTVKNANTVSIDTISTDSINSNNTWQSTQQCGNFLCDNNNS